MFAVPTNNGSVYRADAQRSVIEQEEKHEQDSPSAQRSSWLVGQGALGGCGRSQAVGRGCNLVEHGSKQISSELAWGKTGGATYGSSWHLPGGHYPPPTADSKA